MNKGKCRFCGNEAELNENESCEKCEKENLEISGFEDVTVKTWSMNETRHFRQWLRKLKGKKIRIISVTSKGDYLTKVVYEALER